MSLLFNPQCRTGTSTEACASVQGAKIQNIFESNSLFVEKLIINGRNKLEMVYNPKKSCNFVGKRIDIVYFCKLWKRTAIRNGKPLPAIRNLR